MSRRICQPLAFPRMLWLQLSEDLDRLKSPAQRPHPAIDVLAILLILVLLGSGAVPELSAVIIEVSVHIREGVQSSLVNDGSQQSSGHRQTLRSSDRVEAKVCRILPRNKSSRRVNFPLNSSLSANSIASMWSLFWSCPAIGTALFQRHAIQWQCVGWSAK